MTIGSNTSPITNLAGIKHAQREAFQQRPDEAIRTCARLTLLTRSRLMSTLEDLVGF